MRMSWVGGRNRRIRDADLPASCFSGVGGLQVGSPDLEARGYHMNRYQHMTAKGTMDQAQILLRLLCMHSIAIFNLEI